MKNIILASLLIAGTLANTACSNQWRESDPGVDSEYALELFDQISENATAKSAGFNSQALSEVRDDPYSTLYFAESGAAMGEVASIFSFSDTSFLGTVAGQPVPINTNVFDLINGYGLKKVSVIFYDGFTANDERYFTLMLKLETDGAPTYFMAQSNQSNLTDNEFSTSMNLTDGTTLVLRSNDISPDVEGELAGTIQLKAYIVENGIEYSIGQFSVLHGFGGQN